MQTIHVNLGPRSYDIACSQGDSNDVLTFIRSCYPQWTSACVIGDENTQNHALAIAAKLEQAPIRVRSIVVPAGEASKCLEMTARLYDDLADFPADRRTVIVAVGGGVIGDLAGFVAATYNRGLPLFMIPTTLLAMVDSSVGGKVGINHPRGKNLIGAFHQPIGVWIDSEMLSTLPDREYRSGLAEVVKYGVIQDADFFAHLEDHVGAILQRDANVVQSIVARCCRLKADVVEQDEREETGVRAILNYGHTFAHAFEAIGGYGSWLHGEAVAAGMIAESRLAEKLVPIDPAIRQRQMRLLERFGLPIAAKSHWSTDDLIDSMYRDKKTQAGKLRLVLPVRLGEVKLFDNVPESLVREVLGSP